MVRTDQPQLELVMLNYDLCVGQLNHVIDRPASPWSDVPLAGVCVPPFWAKKVRRDLPQEYYVKVAIGYPAGYQLTEDKVCQIEGALQHGADQIALALNLSAFKSGLTWGKIELAKCAQLVHQQEKLFNVILPSAYLSETELLSLVTLCKDTGVDGVTFKLNTPVPPASSIIKSTVTTMEAVLYGPFGSTEFSSELPLESIQTIGITNYQSLIPT